MSNCSLDHSLTDVRKKLEEQESFLPKEIYKGIQSFLNEHLEQSLLNKLFHLLKKYDLSTDEERSIRNAEFQRLIQ